jgi:hypothetical protein
MKTTIALTAFAALWLQAGCVRPAQSQGPTESLETSVRRLPWKDSGGQGGMLQTTNYTIYTTCQGGELLALMPGYLEASHRNYLRLLGLTARQQEESLPIYLLSTRDEWASLTTALVGDNAGPYLQIQSGGYCYRNICVFWQMGVQPTLSIAGHEAFHQYMHHRLADQLPMWLEEGLCTQAEAFDIEGTRVGFDPRTNVARRSDLEGALVRSYWVPVEKLLPMDAGDALGTYVEKTVGYYGQLWALVQFIRNSPTYAPGLNRFIGDAEAGRLHEALGMTKEALAQLRRNGRAYNQAVSEKLFRFYITDDIPAFEKRYKAFCLTLVGLQ